MMPAPVVPDRTHAFGLRCHEVEAGGMVVICSNKACGALLRSARKASPLDVPIQPGETGPYFICPRCGARTELPERRSAPRQAPTNGTQP